MANDQIAALEKQIAELQAKLASAQQASGAMAPPADGRTPTTAASRAVFVGGNNDRDINTGEQVNIGGHVIGRDFIQVINKIVHHGESAARAQSIVGHYLQALVTDLAGLKSVDIDSGAAQPGSEPLQLADIYVPLNTTLRIPAKSSLAAWFARDSVRTLNEPEEARELRRVSALEALAQHRKFTLLGPAGSGKSTFGASVLLAHAQAWQGHSGELERLGSAWTHGALLPIRIILRDFAEQLPKNSETKVRAGDLWRFVADDLRNKSAGLSDATMGYLQDIARNHGAMIFFDGLDECGDPATRARVLCAVDELKRNAGPKCRVLVTARPYARPDNKQNTEDGVYSLAELSDDQVEQFVSAWYGALSRRKWLSHSDAEHKKADLLSVWRRADLERLARNPLLLTLMATLHANSKRLPDDRADLYNSSVDLLMRRWNHQSGFQTLLDAVQMPSLKLSDVRGVLEELAFELHAENAGADGAADIGEDRLVRALCPLLSGSKDKAGIVVDYVEKRVGLLVGLGEWNGERQFAFPHRTFQEYLAACHLAAKDDFPAECVRLARAAPGHWMVALSLAARIAKVERGASAADELIGGGEVSGIGRRPDKTDWECAALAGAQLLEIGLGAVNARDRTRRIAEKTARWLAASLPVHPKDGGSSARQRALAGNVLSQLGDPRFDPQRFHLPPDDTLGFAHIPADAHFRIGTRRTDAPRVAKVIGIEVPQNELNDDATPTSEFYIARYPVTVAQFSAFVQATQFKLGDDDALADPDNRPVRWASWHEAIAYCEWLGAQLKTAKAFDGTELAGLIRSGGWRISLPSELEWEKAASDDRRDAVFSWGDDPDAEQANYEATVGDTSTVGCYPPNGYGLFDMIGNVWEWTQSLYSPYPYQSNDGRENIDAGADVDRVLRGGSWILHRGNARCAFRYGAPPHYRSDLVGFRVVLRPSPV